MQKQHSKPLILVDGSSYLYRAYHAMPSLANSKGIPTGAIYGMVNMLRKLIQDYDPAYMAVIFDSKGKTFRDVLYDKYKANRSAMPDELSQQIDPIYTIIRALGLPLVVVEGVEADDVIGTIAKHAKANDMKTLISTSDKDLAQLVDEHVTLMNTMTGTFLNPETVKEKFGIPPTHIVDYLALIGDTIDNIPGVPLVGPKTAVKWLQEYGSLDNIIVNADKIKGKVGENLRSSLDQIPLSKKLAIIKVDVELNLAFDKLQRSSADESALIKIYQELEFKNWLAELLEKNKNTNQTKFENYETILSESQFNSLIENLSKAPLFAFEIQTTGLNYMETDITGISFALEPGNAAYIPLGHTYLTAPQQLKREAVLQQLKPILENPLIKKIGHNIKYDIEVLASVGILLQGIAYDTMLESYVLDSTSNRHELDSLALKFLGRRTTPYTEIAGKGAKELDFNSIPIESAAQFASEYADVTLQLHHVLWPRIEQEPGLKLTYNEIELPLIPVLARMERHGVLIDSNKLTKQNQELEKRLIELEREIFTLADGEFNLNSPKQLQDILFCKLKLPMLTKTPKGQPSTADAVLQELALDYLLPKLIIEYRSLSKLITTYTKKLPEQINPKTKRIHTSYNQTVAATGRLSSSDPNLQNIPIRTEEGRKIRQAFVAMPGYKLISADYSQIELRIMAHISEEPNLLRSFENNIDVHRATAAEVLNIPLENVTYEERRRAKAINFGLMYGMSAFGLAKQLGLDRQTAQTYIETYFNRYPQVKAYMENTRQTAHSRGFVETLTGRRLYLPDINSSQIPRQKAAERTAINAPLQGTAADIIKKAMISLDLWLEQHPAVDAKMIMQVHDELVFEVADQDVDVMEEIIRKHMMAGAELKVPLVVSIEVGENWDSPAEGSSVL